MWSSNPFFFFFCIRLFPAFFIVQNFQSPDFPGYRFFKAQVFLSAGFSGSAFFSAHVFQGPGPGSGSRFQKQPLLYIKLFQKNKRRSRTSIPASFSASLFLMLCCINRPNFIAFNSLDIGQYVYCIYFLQLCDVINFEINLSFVIKLFSNK